MKQQNITKTYIFKLIILTILILLNFSNLFCQSNQTLKINKIKSKCLVLPCIYVSTDILVLEQDCNIFKECSIKINDSIQIKQFKKFAESNFKIYYDETFKGDVLVEFLILKKSYLTTNITLINSFNKNIDAMVVNFVRRLSGNKILSGIENKSKVLLKVTFDVKQRKKTLINKSIPYISKPSD